jgi:hypothetical protein
MYSRVFRDEIDFAAGGNQVRNSHRTLLGSG